MNMRVYDIYFIFSGVLSSPGWLRHSPPFPESSSDSHSILERLVVLNANNMCASSCSPLAAYPPTSLPPYPASLHHNLLQNDQPQAQLSLAPPPNADTLPTPPSLCFKPIPSPSCVHAPPPPAKPVSIFLAITRFYRCQKLPRTCSQVPCSIVSARCPSSRPSSPFSARRLVPSLLPPLFHPSLCSNFLQQCPFNHFYPGEYLV